MRLDEVFKNLGFIAGTIGAQLRSAAAGVPLAELDLTQPPPDEVALVGPVHVAISRGEVFRIDVEGVDADEVRFNLSEQRLRIAGGDEGTVVHVTLPAPRKLSMAGSGRMECDALDRDAEISVAGSGRLEVAAVAGGDVSVSIAGSGRLMINGRAQELDLSIAGSGACDAEGLVVEEASIHIAGSGDAIFTCNGEVSAQLMGSGNVIVRGSARCSVNSLGSGTVVCERAAADA